MGLLRVARGWAGRRLYRNARGIKGAYYRLNSLLKHRDRLFVVRYSRRQGVHLLLQTAHLLLQTAKLLY